MKNFAVIAIMALSSLLFTTGSPAVTYVYVSNAEDGDIGMYTLLADGSLQPGARFKAGKMVMPMTVSADRRFLVAAVRSKPYSAHTYSIDRGTGALKLVGGGPLAESFPYIQLVRSGRHLLGASYGGNLVSVNPVGADGRVGEPTQVIPTARNAHAIITDRTGRFVFVPHLGTDQVFQFLFDEKSGRLTANTPPLVQLKAGTGPRHLIARQPLRVSAERADGDGDHTRARRQDGAAHQTDGVRLMGSGLAFCARTQRNSVRAASKFPSAAARRRRSRSRTSRCCPA